MLNNIMIGQYFPGDSFLHRMDARVKILLLLILLIEVFVFTSAPVYLMMTGITFLLIMTSKVPLRMVLRSLKPLWWIILFTFVLHLFSHPGRELCRVWQFVITQEGVEQGSLISVRLMLLMPFKRLGLPAHELAMMMTIALRFIPTLISETDKIMKAQQSRGADFVTGSIMSRLKNMVPILVPLFLSAFRRADDLALAMEARCYRGGEGRTRMKEMKLGRLDYVAIGVFAVLSVGLGVSYGL